MKKTVSIGLGGRNFIFDEDAYILLDKRLSAYEASLTENVKDVVDDVEMRIADLCKEKLSGGEVVNRTIVEQISAQLGLPECEDGCLDSEGCNDACGKGQQTVHKFFRDTDDRKIGGVCSGIAAYCDIDVVLVRIIALILLICASAGFWIYLIFCIVAPSAHTAVEKCQMRGLPCTAENIRKFSESAR